jgi:hypothetical protein
MVMGHSREDITCLCIHAADRQLNDSCDVVKCQTTEASLHGGKTQGAEENAYHQAMLKAELQLLVNPRALSPHGCLRISQAARMGHLVPATAIDDTQGVFLACRVVVAQVQSEIATYSMWEENFSMLTKESGKINIQDATYCKVRSQRDLSIQMSRTDQDSLAKQEFREC